MTDEVQILKCVDCGRHVVAVGGVYTATRINDHKCSGSWVKVLEVALSTWEWKRMAAAAKQSAMEGSHEHD